MMPDKEFLCVLFQDDGVGCFPSSWLPFLGLWQQDFFGGFYVPFGNLCLAISSLA
jgi:hypothetical protein